jgi:hypothetical protein
VFLEEGCHIQNDKVDLLDILESAIDLNPAFFSLVFNWYFN